MKKLLSWVHRTYNCNNNYSCKDCSEKTLLNGDCHDDGIVTAKLVKDLLNNSSKAKRYTREINDRERVYTLTRTGMKKMLIDYEKQYICSILENNESQKQLKIIGDIRVAYIEHRSLKFKIKK